MNAHDTAAGFALKAAPPAGVGGMSLMGFSLPEWVIILTLIYTALSIITLVKDKYLCPLVEVLREQRKSRK